MADVEYQIPHVGSLALRTVAATIPWSQAAACTAGLRPGNCRRDRAQRELAKVRDLILDVRHRAYLLGSVGAPGARHGTRRQRTPPQAAPRRSPEVIAHATQARGLTVAVWAV